MKIIVLFFSFFCFAFQLHAQDTTKIQDTTKNAIGLPIETMPEFPGGMAEFKKYIAKNLQYPKGDKDAKIEGKVTVKFVVNKDGSVVNVEIMPGTDGSSTPEMRQEAIRVVSESPKWKPGTQAGEPVSINFTMPIWFQINKTKSARKKRRIERREGIK